MMKALKRLGSIQGKVGRMLGVAIATITVGGLMPVAVQAEPADVFKPHINDMVTSVPAGFSIRLPSELYVNGNNILLDGRGELGNGGQSPFTVKVFASQTPLSLVVSIFSCDPDTALSTCLFGTVTNDRSTSLHARAELDRHRRVGDRITFQNGNRGYLIDGSRSGTRSKFSSVVWQQSNMIYTLSFPATSDRQSLIEMARSMTQSRPVRPTLPRSIPASVPPSGSTVIQ